MKSLKFNVNINPFKNKRNSERQSFFVISLCLFFVFSLAFWSELFQVSGVTNGPGTIYNNPFGAKLLESINQISLKNNRGSFTLLKKEKFEKDWRLTAPRKLPANYETIENILSSLESIKIKRLHPLDAVNKTNFSLDTPRTSIVLMDQKNKEINISLGLINTLDNSFYFTISGKDIIFQADQLALNFNALDLASFIDAKIFHFDLDKLLDFSVYKGLAKKANNHLTVKKNQDKWIDSNNRSLDKEKIGDYLKKFLALSAHTILDQRSLQVEESIAELLQSPRYTVSIKTSNNENLIYKISNIVNSIPGLKLEKRAFVLVTSNDREFPYLVPKSFLDLFDTREAHLRGLNVKKLFY